MPQRCRVPSSVALFESGRLQERVSTAKACMQECSLCAHGCGVDRRNAQGQCRTGMNAVVYSFGPHGGEEEPLVGEVGSGTIFFSSCNLNCVFCQNWTISQEGGGEEVSPARLAEIMLRLQARGCSNINFVSPSHVIAPILEAVLTAAEQGLTLPLVYNSGGYDSLEGLRLLDGVIDIYMPDMKFGTSERGQKYAWVADYTEVNQAAVSEMHRQVGDLVCDNAGIAERGLLVRHLVLPNDLADTRGVLAYVAEHISIDTYLNLMPQYRPCYRADSHSGIEIPLRKEDYKQAVEYASEVGLTRCQVKDVFWFW